MLQRKDHRGILHSGVRERICREMLSVRTGTYMFGWSDVNRRHIASDLLIERYSTSAEYHQKSARIGGPCRCKVTVDP
jgi:hypothetical protein